MSENWKFIERPGYFGRRRQQRHAEYTARFGHGKWRLIHRVGDQVYGFEDACRLFYEESYYVWLRERPDDVDFICSFGECVDNAPSNILSGTNYVHQESFSNRIQDIAVRNVLKRLGRWFKGPEDTVLVIRSPASNGYQFGPGNIPFHKPELICQPEICPRWANTKSTEAFWQSNKELQAIA
jgi:diadenosine tetraphosphatase ApaH/serine/threonine PP2A family protein phosphatase